jgi:hypothetical protein
LQTHLLSAHPAHPPGHVEAVNVAVGRDGERLSLHYTVRCPTRHLAIPRERKPDRADNLWQTTCFELFVLGENEGYREFNFSPSHEWAAYRFDSYREGLRELGLDEPPKVISSDEGYGLILSANLRWTEDAMPKIGLSAVIEERGGIRSYWALAHRGDKPDFHDPACFTVTLPAPRRP